MLRGPLSPEPGLAFVHGLAQGQKPLEKQASPSRPGAWAHPTRAHLAFFLWVTITWDVGKTRLITWSEGSALRGTFSFS